MSLHHPDDLAEVGRGVRRSTGEGIGQVAEEPRSPQATPSHHHAVASGGLDHGQRVGCLPEVAVPQHRYRGDHCLEGGDGLPLGRARVELLGSAGVQGDRGHPLVLGDPPRLEEGEVVTVHPEAQLDGDRHRPGRAHRGGEDGAEQDRVEWEGGTGPLTGHLPGRASEIEVDVVNADLADQPVHGGAHHRGVDPAELDAAHRLVLPEGGHGQGLGVALDQGSGGDHLAHIQAGAVGPAQPPEGDVGDPGHRGQHHRGIDGDRAQLEGRNRRTHRRGPAHRSMMPMSSWANRERRSGRERPITLPGSPSTPSMNGAERPSRVNAPATAIASPVAR